jgi:hypothetical protein
LQKSEEFCEKLLACVSGSDETRPSRPLPFGFVFLAEPHDTEEITPSTRSKTTSRNSSHLVRFTHLGWIPVLRVNLTNLERVVEFARRPPIEDDGVNQTVPATGAAQPAKRIRK